MIRFILIIAVVVCLLICLIPLQFVEFLIGKYKGQQAKDALARKIIRFAFRVVLFLTGSKVECRGQELIPTDEAVLYISNHRSMLDIIVSYLYLPGPTGYIAKIESRKIPLLSSWMVLIRCLFLDRSNPREGLKTILAGIDQIKEGVSVFVFPEGTRGPAEDGGMHPFKEGTFKMAEKTDCRIVPVAMTGTREIFEAHFPFVRPSKVTLQFGRPFRPSELSKEERKFIGAHTRNIIAEMLAEAAYNE